MNSSTALKAAQTGWSAYQTVKSGVTAVTKPVQWLKDKLVGLLVSALLAAFKATLGPALAQMAVERLNLVGKTFTKAFEVPVPAAARDHLADPLALQLVKDIANEALAGPLELLGYRAGRVDVEYLTDAGRLRLTLELGMLPAALPAPANP